MKPAFSAPVYADGRLYFGEGLHTDDNSRLFCLDAATGKKLWQYATESHTESTPFVADGKVVVGAGYHGLHCVDAADGKPLWIYPKDAKAKDKLAHVDCNPVIAEGRVYAASGYKPDYITKEGKINRIFCVDLKSGDEIWTERVDDSVYGSPLVHDGRVYYGTGNSTFSENIKSKRPGILCREAATGKPVWDCIFPEVVPDRHAGVLGRPAADRFQLYAGCLDGMAYTIDLRTGQIINRLDMKEPLLASPVIDVDAKTGVADIVYFAGKNGLITAVAPYSGKVFWSAPMSYWAEQTIDDLPGSPTLLRSEDADEITHRLFIGFGQGKNNSTVPRLFCIEDKTRKK
jgi:outer membrane protein assembly factor BamB